MVLLVLEGSGENCYWGVLFLGSSYDRDPVISDPCSVPLMFLEAYIWGILKRTGKHLN